MEAREIGRIVPQRERNLEQVKDQLDHLAWLMDNYFRIPGLGWRFGFEAIIGLIPGFGDVVSGVIGVVLLMRAVQFKLPKIVITRMVLNNLIDITVGAIPFLGDLFDFAFKANTRNMVLFRQYAEGPTKSTKSHWIFLICLMLGFAFILGLIAYGTYAILRLLLGLN
jgi:hypothetical protein